MLRRTCRKWMPPSTKRDIAKLANGTMQHFLVHGKWPDGSVAPVARQWIPENLNDAADDGESRAAAIERYNGYMFAEADTSSDESCSDKGDEEEGRRIAAMDDAPPRREAEATEKVERGGGQPGLLRRDLAKSSRFQRFYDKGKAVAKTNANLLEGTVQDQRGERLRMSGYWAAAGLAARTSEGYWITALLSIVAQEFLEARADDSGRLDPDPVRAGTAESRISGGPE